MEAIFKTSVVADITKTTPDNELLQRKETHLLIIELTEE